MPKTRLGLDGPYDLSNEVINNKLAEKAPGNFALGHVDQKGAFFIALVGRSDGDLAGRLKMYIGKYKSFKAEYADSAMAAFERECQHYHDFRPPENEAHPQNPLGTDAKCPRCGKQGR